MRRIHIVLFVMSFLLFVSCNLAVSHEFSTITGPCDFVFPRDHSPHPDYKTEWWYYTGSLRGPSGEKFGFQFTIFRSRIKAENPMQDSADNVSPWRSNQILLGHAAISDVSLRKHHQHEVVSRVALNLAGWRPENQAGQDMQLLLRDWSLSIAPDVHSLVAKGADFSFALSLAPKKGPIAHGDRGYSRKGVRPESASCYYSIPRMEVSGQIVLEGKSIPVTGQAWMDKEYSSAPLEAGIVGWDWFSLRLSDGSELMAFFLRAENGVFATGTSGTLISPAGTTTQIDISQLTLTPTGNWTSPRSKARYPSGWKLTGPGVELVIEPEIPDQEMNTPLSTGVNYWEGLVRATGVKSGRPVTAEGYVELTGYDKAFRARY